MFCVKSLSTKLSEPGLQNLHKAVEDFSKNQPRNNTFFPGYKFSSQYFKIASLFTEICKYAKTLKL